MVRVIYPTVAGLLLASCGCVQYASLIEVNSDGSGKLIVRQLMSDETKQALGLAGLFGSKDDDEEKEKRDTKKAQEQIQKIKKSHENYADQHGDALSIVEQKNITKKGWHGIQTTYAFDDISELRLNNSPPKVPDDEGEDKEKDDFPSSPKSLQFKLVDGELTISPALDDKQEKVGDDPFSEAGIELEAAPTSSLNFASAVATQFAKVALQGARITTLIKVNGRVTETNAPHQTKPGTFVLLDFDLGEFAASEKFDQAIQQRWEFDRLLTENVPGLKAADLTKPVRIKFSDN